MTRVGRPPVQFSGTCPAEEIRKLQIKLQNIDQLSVSARKGEHSWLMMADVHVLACVQFDSFDYCNNDS